MEKSDILNLWGQKFHSVDDDAILLQYIDSLARHGGWYGPGNEKLSIAERLGEISKTRPIRLEEEEKARLWGIVRDDAYSEQSRFEALNWLARDLDLYRAHNEQVLDFEAFRAESVLDGCSDAWIKKFLESLAGHV